ncbi:MAG: V-type ATP synthase subunit K [Corallococcus sp.]|nr:V-type ATP synthase subunit K [Corallococcus sp.]
MSGLTIAIIGLAICAITCGVGSAFGLKFTGSASAGVLAEDPSKASKITLLTLLPATQGLYGFAITLIGLFMNVLPAAPTAATTAEQAAVALSQGWSVFGAVMPMAILGLFSAILQGKTSATTIMAVGKKPEISGKAFLYPAMIEFYAILGLVASIMILSNLAA